MTVNRSVTPTYTKESAPSTPTYTREAVPASPLYVREALTAPTRQMQNTITIRGLVMPGVVILYTDDI